MPSNQVPLTVAPRAQRPPAPVVHQVDVDRAHAVAAAFIERPRRSKDPLVVRAYQELAAQADRWFGVLTDHRRGPGIRVALTGCPEPYASGEELAGRVRQERVLELCPAATRPEPAHPAFDVSPGGAYDRFRAVHDLLSHAGGGFGFDRDGEYSAWLHEDRLYRGLARWALATELHAEHSVLWTTGTRAEHKAALLPIALVAASRSRTAAIELPARSGRRARGPVDGDAATGVLGHRRHR